jgi:hypothetical protein
MPFDRFAPAQPAGGQWSPQQDARGYDLGSYMPASGQDPAFAPQDHMHPGAPAHGYAETDAEYDDVLQDDDEEPSRSRRGLMIVGVLVGAIGLGGALAYTYKAFTAPSPGRAPLVKANDGGPNKVRPVSPGGKEFAHTDKKILNRLDESGAGAPADDDRANDDPNAPRKVRIIPIAPNGQPASVTTASTPPARPAAAQLPGIMLDNMPTPSAARPQMPPQQPPAASAPRVAPQGPPVRVVTPASTPPPQAIEPPPPPAKKVAVAAPPAKKPVPRTEAADHPQAATATTANGFVAVLSSQKSRMDALKAFADLQQKYGDVLAAKTPDVQEANLGEKGVWYRAVVGPPGSRDAASGVCSQLKTAGYNGCWVTAY